MNCSDFEKIVVDLARGLSLDAMLKQRGMEHASSCVRCASRLKTEQVLTSSLRAVAKNDLPFSAPTSVENALLAAFRAQAEVLTAPARTISPTSTESIMQRWFAQFRWMLIPATAVAAIVLIVLAVTRMTPTTDPSKQVTVNESPLPGHSKASAPAVPDQIKAPMPEVEELPPQELAKQNVRRVPMAVKATTNRPFVRQPSGRVTVDVGPFEVDEPEAISANEFLVFDYARTLPPADSMQLMRVRMPRERLAPLGIPLPREARNDNFVNADFLVGSDGVPRAIRVANR